MDKNATIIIVALIGFITVATVGGLYVQSTKSTVVNTKPELYTTIDGCNVYRFEDREGLNYIVRCPNGNASTTDASGKTIITENTK